MSHYVKCFYCSKTFDRDIEPFEQVSARRYAHVDCALAAKNQRSKEEKDKEKLENYIMKLFNETFISPKIRKQLNSFIKEYHYTYSGILNALIYFYEIKHGDISKANQGIGIYHAC